MMDPLLLLRPKKKRRRRRSSRSSLRHLHYFVILFLLVLMTFSEASKKIPITVILINDSGSNLFVQWINPTTGELFDLHQPDDPSRPGTITRYNTKRLDEFVIYEQSGDEACSSRAEDDGEDGEEEVCQRTFFQVPGGAVETEEAEGQQEVFIINDWFQIEHITDPKEIQELFRTFGGAGPGPTGGGGGGASGGGGDSHSGDRDGDQHPYATHLHIRNDSKDSFVEVYFITNDNSNKIHLTKQTGPLQPYRVDPQKAGLSFNTFVGNRFELVQTYNCEDPPKENYIEYNNNLQQQQQQQTTSWCQRIRIVVPKPNPKTSDGKRMDPGILIEDGFYITLFPDGGGDDDDNDTNGDMPLLPYPPTTIEEYWDIRKQQRRQKQKRRTQTVKKEEISRKTKKEDEDDKSTPTTPSPSPSDVDIDAVPMPEVTRRYTKQHQQQQQKPPPTTSIEEEEDDDDDSVVNSNNNNNHNRHKSTENIPTQQQQQEEAEDEEDAIKNAKPPDYTKDTWEEYQSTATTNNKKQQQQQEQQLKSGQKDATRTSSSSSSTTVGTDPTPTPTTGAKQQQQQHQEVEFDAKPPDFTKDTYMEYQAKQQRHQQQQQQQEAMFVPPPTNKHNGNHNYNNIKDYQYTFLPPPPNALIHPKLQYRYRRKAMAAAAVIQSKPRIINYSGVAVDLFNIVPPPLQQNKIKLNHQGPIQNAIQFDFITLVYQEFEIRETSPDCADSNDDDEDQEGSRGYMNDDEKMETMYYNTSTAPITCRRVRFRVGDIGPIITIHDDFRAIMTVVPSNKKETDNDKSLGQTPMSDGYYYVDISNPPKPQSIVSLHLLHKQQQQQQQSSSKDDNAKPFSKRVLEQCIEETRIEFDLRRQEHQQQQKSSGTDDGNETTTTMMMNRYYIESIQECVEQILGNKIAHSMHELEALSIQRKHYAPILESYTCKDIHLETTKPIEVREWIHKVKKKSPADEIPSKPTSPRQDEDEEIARNVSVLLDRPTAKIHLIHNFISDEECEFIERTRMGQYQYAMVADDKRAGAAKVSDHRKAQQAPLRIPWNKQHKGHKFTKVGRRMYDYTSYIMGRNISENGQEEPTLIRYEGKGFDEPHPEQYMAHCDGRCDGRHYLRGMRVATMIMYCAVADAGGHTNFRSSNIHIKPEKGTALFFSYVDSDLYRHDYGLTQHSGCPIYEGEKLIVTQWIRTGVDDKENPWYLFDEDGNKMTNGMYREMMKGSFKAATGL